MPSKSVKEGSKVRGCPVISIRFRFDIWNELELMKAVGHCETPSLTAVFCECAEPVRVVVLVDRNICPGT